MKDNSQNNLPETKNLILEREHSVLKIWFNRVESRNALNAEMTNELVEVLDYAKDDSSLRTIILRGKGDIFCAGGDIKDFKNTMQNTDINSVSLNNRSFGNVMTKLNEQPQVVIILVEGAAIGGGLGLACVSDITLVHQETKFRLSETSLGIPPAQIAPFVVQRIGITNARYLMLTGAKFDGKKAFEIGLAHAVFQDSCQMEQRLADILSEINECAKNANAATKKILLKALCSPMTETLDFASFEFANCMLGDEGREGVSAFLEKRKPFWVENDG